MCFTDDRINGLEKRDNIPIRSYSPAYGKVMNYTLQCIQIQRHVLAHYKKFRPNEDPDPIMDSILDSVDPELHLDENISNLYHHGVLEDYSIEYYEDDGLEDVLYRYQITMVNPTYMCEMEGCNYRTNDPKLMKEHFEKEHELKEAEKLLNEPEDEKYVILSILMEKLIKAKPKPRVYFRIESLEILKAMKTKLDYDVPSQRPTKLLKELGLLDRKRGEKIRSFRNYSGRRKYNIKIEDLRFVISKSEYDILKIRYNIEFTEDVEDKPLILSPVDPRDTRGTEPRGTSIDDIYYPPDD